MEYASIKQLHLAAVVVSGIGFTARAIASLTSAAWTRNRLTRTLPHIVDTILLASAIFLAVRIQANPLHTPWLLAKILGLIAYIALGMIALRDQFGYRTRAAASVLAIAVFLWIASVAISKNPWGWIAALSS